jgi:hypothetical protein
VVYDEWPSRNKVRIDLGEQAYNEVKDVFSAVELFKATKVEPDSPTKPDAQNPLAQPHRAN